MFLSPSKIFFLGSFFFFPLKTKAFHMHACMHAHTLGSARRTRQELHTVISATDNNLMTAVVLAAEQAPLVFL